VGGFYTLEGAYPGSMCRKFTTRSSAQLDSIRFTVTLTPSVECVALGRPRNFGLQKVRSSIDCLASSEANFYTAPLFISTPPIYTVASGRCPKGKSKKAKFKSKNERGCE
jgi:hypothetical protein